MTDIIKTRVEALKKGELPEGYKRTKAGIMPRDWDSAVRAKQLFRSHTDKNHNGELEILASTQEHGIVPRNQIGIDIQCSDEGVKGYKKVSKGDFVISLRSFQGGIEYSEYDGIVSPAYTVLKPIKDISTGFYRNYFKTDSFISRLNGAVYGIRDGKQIGYQDFGDMYIPCPPLAEQERIAEILTQCDKIIELKQKKIDELAAFKKECLRRLFPDNECTKPEVRFPGFTDDWEQREFSSVFEMLHNNTLSRADLNDESGFAQNVHYGDVLIKYGEILNVENEPLAYINSKKVVDSMKNSYLQDGDIIIADTAEDATVGKCSEIVNLGDKTVLSGLHTIPVRPNENFASGYLGYYLNSNSYHDTLIPLMQGTKVTSISKSALQGTSITYPKSLDEQAKISAYFLNLDHLIALHQQELDEYRTYKTALSKLLLTGIVRVSI